MAVSAEYLSYIEELFEAAGALKIKRMFGGAGLFVPGPPGTKGDAMFGLIVNDTVYLKVNDNTQPAFEEHKCAPFSYQAKGVTRGLKSYYQMPEFLYDDPDELTAWARTAREVALRTQKPKRKKSKT